MFDYSNVTPRDFEYIAQEYLESVCQGSSWHLTNATGDGNRDIELSFQFLDQSLEYWAEAKFTRQSTVHKLQKSQLDPTLLSAMLYSKPVFVKFISNNMVPENYFYRLTDFKIKTNIGVTMVLKDEFEQWLEQNPNVCQRYGIVKNESKGRIDSSKSCKIKIDGALITNEINLNGYTLERKLVQGNTYFLYLVIYSNKLTENVSLQFQTAGFQFISNSSLLDNHKSFSLKQGTYGYKFRFSAEKPFSGNLCISLLKDSKIIGKSNISMVSVLPSSNYKLAYAQQSKFEAEILELTKTAEHRNKTVIIYGNGASGKTYLIKNLYRDLSCHYETIFFSFSDNELYNCKQLFSLLLYLNIGDTTDYPLPAIKKAVEQYTFIEKKRFLLELLKRGNDAPKKCIDFLQLKNKQNMLQMIFPQHVTMRKIIILDDIHKLQSFPPIAELLYHLISEFVSVENNQFIIATSRKKLKIPHSYEVTLDGLSYKDKMTTLMHYFSDLPDKLNFHRTTDSVLIFSNVLRELVEKKADEKRDLLRFMAQIKHSFEHVENKSEQEYQSYLNDYSEHSNLIELVFIVNSGIPYVSLNKLFNTNDIDYLIENKIFKLVSGNVYPFHDLYVTSYFKKKNISSETSKNLELMAEIDINNSYIYLSLLLKQGNALFFSNIVKARELRDHYFNLSRLYESHLLAKAIVDHINFNEPIDKEEIYDVYILANSSFYSKNCDEIIALYNIVLSRGYQYQADPKMWGVLLRTRTELMNQYYWDLKLDKLKTEFQIANDSFPIGEPKNHEIIRFACIHRINRKMVFELLMCQYEDAKANYKFCVQESQRLNHKACLGFAEMDYGKGLYLINKYEALDHMEKALKIFKEIGTEHRRQLDCICEVAFLRCLINGTNAENLHDLESAALALRQSHYEEIYAKAKLKLAALHLCGMTPNLQCAESEIIDAEYVLSFRPSKRLDMLFSNIKYVYYTLKKQKSNAQKELEIHKTITQELGEDYSTIPRENMAQCFPQQAAFFKTDNLKSKDTIWIDPRIW